MRKLILVLLLVPFFTFSQGPSFTVTDSEGITWDSQTWLDQGVTIVIQFFAPSETCWPSYQALENLSIAYDEYGKCNDLLFLQVATWGEEYTCINYVEQFGEINCPIIDGFQGNDMAMSWYGDDNFGLQAVYELWVLHPDGSYDGDVNFASDLDQTVLIDLLEDSGFESCEHNVGLEDEEEYVDWFWDETIYDLQGRVLKEIPKSGFYIKGGKKYCVIKR